MAKTKTKTQVLSASEVKELEGIYSRQPDQVVKVKAHERSIWLRTGQQKKNKCIDDFILRFVFLLERYGVTPDDARHVAAASRMLQEAIKVYRHNAA